MSLRRDRIGSLAFDLKSQREKASASHLEEAILHGATAIKTCMLTSAHSPLDDRIFYKEARSLAQSGYDVLVVGPHHACERREAIGIVAVTRRGGRSARILIGPIDVLIAALRARAQIYHFHDPELIPVGFLLRLLGKRVIYDIHEYTVEDIASKGWIPASVRPLVSRIMGWLERRAVRHMDGVVVVNDHMAERIRRLVRFPDRVASVCNFPEVVRFDPGPDFGDREPLALYLGSLGRDRGWEILLEAGRRLRQSYPEGQVWVVGILDPTGVREAYRMVEQWCQYGVQYAGVVTHREVPTWLNRARVGLIPWLATPNHVRGMPVKLFEYMAAGIPVVAPDFGFIRQIVRDAGCGLLVQPGDPVALSEAVEQLLRNPQASAVMGERGRRAVGEKYTGASEAPKLLALYEAIGRGCS